MMQACTDYGHIPKAQLMLTNPRDAFKGQSSHQTWYYSIR